MPPCCHFGSASAGCRCPSQCPLRDSQEKTGRVRPFEADWWHPLPCPWHPHPSPPDRAQFTTVAVAAGAVVFSGSGLLTLQSQSKQEVLECLKMACPGRQRTRSKLIRFRDSAKRIARRPSRGRLACRTLHSRELRMTAHCHAPSHRLPTVRHQHHVRRGPVCQAHLQRPRNRQAAARNALEGLPAAKSDLEGSVGGERVCCRSYHSDGRIPQRRVRLRASACSWGSWPSTRRPSWGASASSLQRVCRTGASKCRPKRAKRLHPLLAASLLPSLRPSVPPYLRPGRGRDEVVCVALHVVARHRTLSSHLVGRRCCLPCPRSLVCALAGSFAPCSASGRTTRVCRFDWTTR